MGFAFHRSARGSARGFVVFDDGSMTSCAPKDVLGRHGEDLAARHLVSTGYELLERNWRSTDRDVRGELDIVARVGAVLVFCEVKTRRSDAFGSPAEAVSFDKQGRIRRLARCWLEQHEPGWAEVRFDVVAVLCPRGGPVSIEQFVGAF